MVESVRNIAVDLYNPRAIQVYAKQGDIFTRHICVTVYDNGTPVFIDKNSVTAIMKYLTQTGNASVESCEITDDGKILITISDTLTKDSGRVIADISLVEKNVDESVGKVISTMQFCFIVMPSSISPEDVYDRTDFNAMYDFMNKALKDYSDIMQAAGGLIVLVKSVNGIMPDDNANIQITMDDITGTIDSSKIEDNAITGDKIANGSISSSKIGLDAVRESNLSKEAVTEYKLADNSVSNSKIKNSTITRDKVVEKFLNENDMLHIIKLGMQTRDIDMGGNTTVKNLKSPVNNSDAATKEYVDNHADSGIISENYVVETSDWTAHNNGTYLDLGFIYRAFISMSGVDENYKPTVTFGATDALSGKYAPTAETANGGVFIYSKINNAIAIPNVFCSKVKRQTME